MHQFFAGLGILGILAWICLVAFGLGMTIYGLYLAFSVSILLGIVVLVVEPAPFIVGLVMFFGGVNLVEVVAKALGWS